MQQGVGRGAGAPGRGNFGGFRVGYANSPRPATCYKCGGPNHFARDCQAQAMKCYACGKLVYSEFFGRDSTHTLTASFRATSLAIVLRLMGGPLILLARPVIVVVKLVTSLVTVLRLNSRTAKLQHLLLLRPQPLLLRVLLQPQLLRLPQPQ
jgi:hypothetical protein